MKKIYYIECTTSEFSSVIKGYFETEEAEVITYNKSFTYELFVKARTMLFSNHDFIVKTPKKFEKYESGRMLL